jgi:hypothetical protein
MTSRDSSNVTLCKGQHGSGSHGHDVQSSLVKSFLKFRKGEPLTHTLLLQEGVILGDPPEVACQSESSNGRGAESG